MGFNNLCTVILIILPFCMHCQDGTTLGSSGQTPTTQPTAAVVQENITKSTTTPKPDTNHTSSPKSHSPGSNNASSSPEPTSQSSNASSTNASTATPRPATNETTTATTLASGNNDEGLPTEETVSDETTATVDVDNEDSITTTAEPTSPSVPAYYELCPSGLSCEMLGAQCLNCSMDTSCVYGKEYNTTCWPKNGLDCVGSLPLQKIYQCRYCYQTETWQQSCTPANNCHVYACPKQYIRVNCTVDEDVFCLGSRNFHRKKPCNWTSGSKWSTALILSITLGGFGADRFYLGYWQSGLGKLFSFGGAGVWTLIDVLLIAVGYITPSDGSHYIY